MKSLQRQIRFNVIKTGDQNQLRIHAVSPAPLLSYTWSMEIEEGSEEKSDIQPHWMAVLARLKNEFTEDEKYHNLMPWL